MADWRISERLDASVLLAASSTPVSTLPSGGRPRQRLAARGQRRGAVSLQVPGGGDADLRSAGPGWYCCSRPLMPPADAAG